MNAPELHSCLAGQLQRFLDLRRLAGTDYHSQAQLLGYFDRFLDDQGVTEPRLTREITDAYQDSLRHLRPRTRDNRCSVVRQFCEYLSRTDPRGATSRNVSAEFVRQTRACPTSTASPRSSRCWPPPRDCRP
jgi:site-specific recombinase XerD